MICHHKGSSLFCSCLLVTGLCMNAAARTVRLKVETVRCDQGGAYHPDQGNMMVFDASKVPQIILKLKELKTALDLLNSDQNAIDRALALYDQLQKLVANTPALARLRKLPKPDQLIELPPIRNVVIVVFAQNEYDDFNYAGKEFDVSPNLLNSVTLYINDNDECKKRGSAEAAAFQPSSAALNTVGNHGIINAKQQKPQTNAMNACVCVTPLGLLEIYHRK